MGHADIRAKATLLIKKHDAGDKLTLAEVSTLMEYAIELSRFIRTETEACIARLEEQFGHKI